VTEATVFANGRGAGGAGIGHDVGPAGPTPPDRAPSGRVPRPARTRAFAPIELLYGARHPGHAAGLVVQPGFGRWDPVRLVEAYVRIAGDDVADIARRAYAGKKVAGEDSAGCSRRSVHTGPTRSAKRTLRRTHIDAPTLVSVGDADPVTPVAAAEEIVRALPDGIGELDVVEGAGHFTWMDAPKRYWPALLEFVERVGARERTRV